jgi:hypothetical protein
MRELVNVGSGGMTGWKLKHIFMNDSFNPVHSDVPIKFSLLCQSPRISLCPDTRRGFLLWVALSFS